MGRAAAAACHPGVSPDQARHWIGQLPTLGAEQWLDHLLAREGALPPPLLSLLGQLPTLDNLPLQHAFSLFTLRHLGQRQDGHARQLPWAEPPLHQTWRVAQAVLAGQNLVLRPPQAPEALAALQSGGAPDAEGAAATAQVAAHIARSAQLSASWLQQASALGADASPPFGAWHLPGVQESVQVPVALIDAGGQGLAAMLTLHRLPHPGAGLGLAPAPASSLLLRTGMAWDEALADVQGQVAQLLGDTATARLADTAIAWDLALTDSRRLGCIGGPSASASVALGLLWLLRDHAPPGWQALLARLTAADLATAAVSAALGPGLSLLPVEGTLDKARSLHAVQQALAGHPRAARLVLHVSALQGLPSAPVPGQVAQQPHDDVHALVQHLARQADPLNDEQATLLQALLQPGDTLPRTVDDALLQRVFDAPVHTLRQYLLHGWAAFSRLLGGQVHQRFVPLRVAPDARGFAHPKLLAGLHGDFPGGLQQVLRLLDGSGIQGYVLGGEPGSGKTTLLRHHLQLAARRTLRRLCLPGDLAEPDLPDGHPTPGGACAAGQRQPQLLELPVYLSLAGLKQGVTDMPAWALEQLSAYPPELAALLRGQGAWGELGLRPRVLLDGLNELPVAHADQRAARAGEVVLALHAWLAGGRQGAPLPLLLSIREHHAVRLTPLVVLPVGLRAWEQPQITQYLALRFPQDDETQRSARLKTLADAPGALDLCSRPMHLAQQCDLMDDGFAAPPGHRAALYAAWQWCRLRRALNVDGRHPTHHDPTLWDETPGAGPDTVLLTDADRRSIESEAAWRSGRLHQLPLQGQLLRCLLQQAEEQWHAATQGPATGHNPAGLSPSPADQLAEPVPWAGVAKHLPDALRQRFGRAVQALGLVRLDEGLTTWQFSHPSWGEYLASVRLLAAGPPASPQLLQRLQAVPPPCASDEEQLRQLGGGGPAWRQVPPALWRQLLREGLTVDLRILVDSYYGVNTLASATFDARLQYWRTSVGHEFMDPDHQVLQVDAKAGTVKADLARWGRFTGVDDALGLTPDAWQASAAGWQFLVQHRLFPIFGQRFYAWLAEHAVPADLVKRLQGDQGLLALPPQPAGAELLGLALLALDDAALVAWLCSLLADPAHTLWPALQPALPALQARLEPQGAWGEAQPAGTPPGTLPTRHPLLQHLRRVLLLTMLDAGAASAAGLRRSGMLALLDAAEPAGLPRVLRHQWRAQRVAAFLGPGQRLAVRLQAGLLLGRLGDTIRYERRARSTAPGEWGLRPRRALWAVVGDLEEGSFHPIGSPPGPGQPDNESPPWQVHLPGFEACRLPLTVAEWQCFHRSTAGQQFAWAFAGDPRFNNPLQPVTGIDWYAMRAYADWARPLYADWEQADTHARRRPLQPALPTELQWEAAARAPAPPPTLGDAVRLLWQRLRGQAVPAEPAAPPAGSWQQDLAFNHANTRWLRPSPVGVFSRDVTPAGLADMRGNVWERCSSVLTTEQLARGWHTDADRQVAGLPAKAATDQMLALRGGAYIDTTGLCRPALRYHDAPDLRLIVTGVRLVRLWLPHSEPRTPSVLPPR